MMCSLQTVVNNFYRLEWGRGKNIGLNIYPEFFYAHIKQVTEAGHTVPICSHCLIGSQPLTQVVLKQMNF